jgi:hypothetical protein
MLIKNGRRGVPEYMIEVDQLQIIQTVLALYVIKMPVVVPVSVFHVLPLVF